MTLTYRIGAGGASTVDLGDVVWLGDLPGATSRADGSVGMSGVAIQDPAGSLNIPGLNKFEIVESACTSNTRIFSGIVADRGISRGEYTTEAGRVWETNLADQNAYLNLRIIRDGNHGNRPAETDVARAAWLLAEVLNAGHVQNGTGGLFGANGPTAAVLAAPRDLDAADYRGQYAADVLADIGPPGNRRFFTYWDPTLAKVCLFYGLNTDYLATSTLRISNVAADADSVTFAPDQAAALDRDPSAVYGSVLYKYRHGTIYREDPATMAAFLDRGVSIENDRVGLAATASTFVDRILAKAGAERDSTTVTIRIPKAQVNLVVEGMRIQVKFSHLPGYESFTYLHVLSRAVLQDVETTDFYNVRLELCDYVGGFGTGGSGSGGGSVAPPPYVPKTSGQLVSLYEAITIVNPTPVSAPISDAFDIAAGRPWRLDLRLASNTSGRVLVNCDAGAQPINHGVSAGVLLYIEDNTGLGVAATNCRVVLGPNAGETMVTHAIDAGSVFYTDADPTTALPDVGQATTEALTGLAAATDYELNFPYAPGSLHVSVADSPTTAGVVVTPTEIDSTTGTFQLGFDATGKTIKVVYQIDSPTGTGSTNPQPTPSTSLPSAGAPSTADYLVGTAQAGLSAEIVVGTTPAGELGGTWAAPTVDTVHSGSAHVTTLDGLSDVVITAAAAGDRLRFNGTNWINDSRMWKPLMDGLGNVVTDSGTGEAIMAEVVP